MSKRNDAEFVDDIKEAIQRIERYTAGLTLDTFLADTKTQDATVRNLEIIGEAVKGLSSDFRKQHRAVKWQDIAGMRDRLIHNYAGVNWEIVWDVLQTKLPELRRQLEEPSTSRTK
jgi:uncharacterized protein with HEPN domain